MVYSIIPARAGSKGVPGKNIRLLAGYPLIAYAICASRLSLKIERTIVSTDSEEIAGIARRYGAEAPFLRPAAISQDNSTDLELIRQAMSWFAEKEGVIPDLFVHLRPTTPLRIPSEIERAINFIQVNPGSTSLRSAHELPEPPQKMLQLDADGFFTGFFPEDPRPEYYNLPRQIFPRAYHPNGYIDIIKTGFVRKAESLHGPRILGFITPAVTEVDRPEDFEYLEYKLARQGNPVYEYLTKNFPREE